MGEASGRQDISQEALAAAGASGPSDETVAGKIAEMNKRARRRTFRSRTNCAQNSPLTAIIVEITKDGIRWKKEVVSSRLETVPEKDCHSDRRRNLLFLSNCGSTHGMTRLLSYSQACASRRIVASSKCLPRIWDADRQAGFRRFAGHGDARDSRQVCRTV